MRKHLHRWYVLAPLICAVGFLGAWVHAPQGVQKKQRSSAMPQAENFRIFNPDTMFVPTVGYSQVAEVKGGKLVYIAGQVAYDKAGNLAGKDDFAAQAEQVFKNLKAAVEAAGGSMHDVIKLNYYCPDSVDPAQIPAIREIRDRYINTQNPPTSTFVIVRRLVRPEWLIEIEAVAVVNP